MSTKSKKAESLAQISTISQDRWHAKPWQKLPNRQQSRHSPDPDRSALIEPYLQEGFVDMREGMRQAAG
jgi:hypothetical protein